MKSTDNQSIPVNAVGGLSKLIGKDPKSTVIAIVTLICFWLLYENHRKDIVYNERIDTYNVLIFGLVRDVKDNGKEIEVIKTKKAVEDSLQNK